MLRLKLLFNRKWPYHRLCLTRWCLRGQVYNSACAQHQPKPSQIMNDWFESNGTIMDEIRNRRERERERDSN